MAVRTFQRRKSRIGARAIGVLAAALAVVFAGPAVAASATDPISLGQGYVYDDVGVLSSAEANGGQERLEQLRDDTGLSLWVVYVDAFTNPSDAEQWADAVAQNNGLNDQQYLLAIGTESRQVYLSYDSAGPLSDDEISTIVNDGVIPSLGDGDWAGAIDAAATGITNAAGGASGGEDAGAGGSGVFTIVLVVIVVVVVVVLAIVLIARRRKKTLVAEAGSEPRVALDELERRASAALVVTDDAIRTSEQELGFATAEFGDAATSDFSAALTTAKQKLEQAFTLKQQLDDATPDTPQQKRSWNAQIIELCEQANDDLDDKAEAFEELRKLAADAPAAIERIRAAHHAAASGIDGAAASLQALRGTYATDALATVADNVEQARARLTFADQQITAAAAALTSGDAGEAAVGIRSAEDAVEQAVGLESAISTLGQSLAAGEQQAAALIPELEDDIAAARSIPDPDGRIAAAVAETTTRIQTARAALSGTDRRPLQTLRLLQEADQGIDAVVQQVRDAAATAQRVGRQLDALLTRAQAQISAAEDFITARRGAVGADARTRLAEAGTALVRAQQLRTSAPDQAMQEAQRADGLAGQAIQLARTDVGGFSVPDTGRTSGGGDDFMGALLGGLIGSSLGGGSSRRASGFGGFGGFGGLGGGGSSRRSGGGRGGGSFGGGRSHGGGSRGGGRGGGRF